MKLKFYVMESLAPGTSLEGMPLLVSVEGEWKIATLNSAKQIVLVNSGMPIQPQLWAPLPSFDTAHGYAIGYLQ